MHKLKILLTDGTTVFIPESNLTKFQQIHFSQVVSVTAPDENGEYPEESFSAPSGDISKAVDGYRKENESLSEENERLTELNEKIISENEKLKEEIEKSNERVNELIITRQSLYHKNIELKTEIASLNLTIEKLQSKTVTENTNTGAEPSKGKPGPKPKAEKTA